MGIHIRGGQMIPMSTPAPTTALSRYQPYSLLIAVDGSNGASGELFWDDGEGIDTVGREVFCLVELNLAGNNISYTFVEKESADLAGLTMDSIRILGLTRRPASFTYSPARVDPVAITFSADKQELHMDGLAFDMGD